MHHSKNDRVEPLRDPSLNLFKTPSNEEETSECQVIWHPYPDEKPTKFCEYYLVTLREDFCPRVQITKFMHFQFLIDSEFIKAWAELPQPYSKNDE